MNAYCDRYGIPFVITATVSTLEEDKALGRKSRTHREARAFDLRSTVFTEIEREEFMKHFEHKYQTAAAITSNGKRSLIVHHNSGHGDHFHIQIHSKFAQKNPLE